MNFISRKTKRVYRIWKDNKTERDLCYVLRTHRLAATLTTQEDFWWNRNDQTTCDVMTIVVTTISAKLGGGRGIWRRSRKKNKKAKKTIEIREPGGRATRS